MLVFVEYESEVDIERGRVKALLEKLRIDAEILVFSLASGLLKTYETIVHGRFQDAETENLVNSCLKNEEWWEDLQNYRKGRSRSSSKATTPPDLPSISQVLESSAGTPTQQSQPSDSSDDSKDVKQKRRHSLAHLTDLPKKPTMSQLVKWGVSMGIHTQNLLNVFDNSDTDTAADSDSDSDSDTMAMERQFTDSDTANGDGDDGVKRPLLAGHRRRKSFADIFTRAKKQLKEKRKWKRTRSPERTRSPTPKRRPASSYGTMTTETRTTELRRTETRTTDSSKETRTTETRTTETRMTEIRSGSVSEGFQNMRGILKSDSRPTLSRHTSSTAMRFTSSLVPETTITNDSPDGTGPRIMFAEQDSKPQFSRQASLARGIGETIEEESGIDRRVSFAELSPTVRSPVLSRRNSFSKGGDNGGDVSLNIAGLLASYLSDDDEYPMHGLTLSFNDLPSRAQHLILNELMRQHSKDTAVMFTTLPIPEENTCQSEEASLAYLSDVEVLCNGLPPVLLVLSNHMTVTVSL